MADAPNKDGLQERPPVIVVVGHVDHGKTTLLDYIRKANVAGKEAGGITQATAAYEIEHVIDGKPRRMTFIDTPGHEAFTKMRSRGAEVADLAILVVAAEEGVKPQTKEAIEILEKTKTPFVVAITKIDKPAADVDKVKNDLMAANVFLEGFGGSTSYQPISSKTGEGVNELLDLLLLAADLAELRYDPSAPAEGFVLETRANKNRGNEASLILTKGVLRQGDDIATPSAKGKARMLENFLGKAAKELHAGSPALMVGFEPLPKVGEFFAAGAAAAEIVAAEEKSEARKKSEAGDLAVILKASDAGSLEALREVLLGVTGERSLRIMDQGVGEVNEGDVKLAISGGAVILAFKSPLDKAAKRLAQDQGVRVVASDIVYELVTAIEEALKDVEHPIVGELEVLAVFNQLRLDKQVIGGRTTKGFFKKMPFEIKRPSSAEASKGKADEIVGKGRVTNLQIDKKDTFQIPEGKEGGIMVGSDVAIAVGDLLVIPGEKV